MATKTLLPSIRVSVRPWRSPFDNLFDAFFDTTFTANNPTGSWSDPAGHGLLSSALLNK